RRFVAAKADCDACRCGAAPRIDAALADFARLAEDCGSPSIAFIELAPDDWRAALTADDMPGGLPTLSRRGLMSFLRTGERNDIETDGKDAAPRADALCLYVPAIDAGACVGCDACIRICPHGALAIGRDGEGRPGYTVEAGRCTGCGLCRDICEAGAVTIFRMERPQSTWIALAERRCDACGAPFHEPVAAETGNRICRICRTTNHARNLYQVLK
ncbi:MAG: 4Fe-4S dicluster domain-containing protein, partial [Hyphomicrobiales bacterium]|nr:4Fe-4S dicluster domain-containing protein [Hyphomicrobiales bacterium]